MKTDLIDKIFTGIAATACIWSSGGLFITLGHGKNVLPAFITISIIGVLLVAYLVIVNYREKK